MKAIKQMNKLRITGAPREILELFNANSLDKRPRRWDSTDHEGVNIGHLQYIARIWTLNAVRHNEKGKTRLE